MQKLDNKTIAILTETGFEKSELFSPREALQKQGAVVHVISPADSIKGWEKGNWTEVISIDLPLSKANSEDYDALLLPGGTINPDKLRTHEEAVEFIRHFVEEGKPVGAICHGPQTLIETGLLKGRKMTSWPSIQTDLINAGVDWVDEECVCDSGLVTSRKPDDLPAFNLKFVEEITEGVHRDQRSK